MYRYLAYCHLPSCHFKKPVFFVMFKKTREYVQKNRDDVQETSPKIGSTETCKKHGKNCTQHGQCLPWRARANIPVFGSWYPHVWKLTCPHLPTNISIFLQRPVHSDVLLHFFFQNVDVQQNVYNFWRHHKKTRVSYSVWSMDFIGLAILSSPYWHNVQTCNLHKLPWLIFSVWVYI
jgi:hypothetical protein